MISKKKYEIEIKLQIGSIGPLRPKIKKIGFALKTKRHLEKNLVFDLPGLPLKKKDILFRLRQAGGENFITLKKPQPAKSDYKIREEMEVEVSHFSTMAGILQTLGFQIFFYYEKYREIHGKGSVRIMIDQTPIGNFIEIEGRQKEIDRVARQLGYRKKDYITATYFQLFKKRENRAHMIFRP